MKRVVVTGMGIVCPVGNNLRESWAAILRGETGVDYITSFDTTDFPVKIAAEVKNFDPKVTMDSKEVRRSTRFVQLAMAAAQEAIFDSGVDLDFGSDRNGCSVGVGMGSLEDIEKNATLLEQKGPKSISPFFIPFIIPNMAAGSISQRFNLKGPAMCPTTACASGTHAIGEAYRYIQSGYADLMVCGGVESVISPLGVAAFSAMKALSKRNDSPKTASRPFDLDRDGFVLGEGAGILILEEYSKAMARGARIYAEMVGYGLSCDAYHITAPAPDGEGGQRSMAIAIKSGEIPIGQVDYINAHGTSTRLNDQYESIAIREVFKQYSKDISVSSTKGATGHCIGGAGGVEAIFTVMAIKHGVIPPTINYSTPDPECFLDYTPNQPKERSIRYGISNSFGFGGVNGTVAFKSFI